MERKRCLSKNRHGDDCTFRCLGDTSFCKFHQYMTSYSKEILAKLELCNGCKKMYYFANEQRTCENCRERAKYNKVKKKKRLFYVQKKVVNSKNRTTMITAENIRSVCLRMKRMNLIKNCVIIIFVGVELN
jgi:hypothetical protein